MTTYRVRVIDVQTGRVYFPGIDWGSSALFIVHQTPTHIVVNVPGHSIWGGIGQARSYVPAHNLVLRVVKRTYDGLTPVLQTESVVDVPLRPTREAYRSY